MGYGMVFASIFYRKEGRVMIEVISGLLMFLGLILMLIIGLALAGLVLAFYAMIGTVLITLAGAIIKGTWFWIAKGMSAVLPKGTDIQKWFEERYLDEKYPSRVRRRRNAKRNINESAATT